MEEVAWYGGNNGSEGATVVPYFGTKPVKQKQPNALGLYDMSGNIYEWCWDKSATANSVIGGTDPVGLASGTYRVSHGGSWNYEANLVRIYLGNIPQPHSRGGGIRLVFR